MSADHARSAAVDDVGAGMFPPRLRHQRGRDLDKAEDEIGPEHHIGEAEQPRRCGEENAAEDVDLVNNGAVTIGEPNATIRSVCHDDFDRAARTVEPTKRAPTGQADEQVRRAPGDQPRIAAA